MPDLYNMTLVSQQGGFIESVLVFNYWSNGILLSGLIIAFALIMFTIARYADRPVSESLIYTGFFGSIVAILMWLFEYNNEPAVPTLIPIMFIFLLGASLVIRMLEGSLRQTE